MPKNTFSEEADYSEGTIPDLGFRNPRGVWPVALPVPRLGSRGAGHAEHRRICPIKTRDFCTAFSALSGPAESGLGAGPLGTGPRRVDGGRVLQAAATVARLSPPTVAFEPAAGGGRRLRDGLTLALVLRRAPAWSLSPAAATRIGLRAVEIRRIGSQVQVSSAVRCRGDSDRLGSATPAITRSAPAHPPTPPPPRRRRRRRRHSPHRATFAHPVLPLHRRRLRRRGRS